MHTNRSQINSELESNARLRPSTPSKLTVEQVRSHDSSNITTIVWKEVVEQRKPRRRSVDNNASAHDERNKEEIVRETLRQANRLYYS